MPPGGHRSWLLAVRRPRLARWWATSAARSAPPCHRGGSRTRAVGACAGLSILGRTVIVMLHSRVLWKVHSKDHAVAVVDSDDTLTRCARTPLWGPLSAARPRRCSNCRADERKAQASRGFSRPDPGGSSRVLTSSAAMSRSFTSCSEDSRVSNRKASSSVSQKRSMRMPLASPITPRVTSASRSSDTSLSRRSTSSSRPTFRSMPRRPHPLGRGTHSPRMLRPAADTRPTGTMRHCSGPSLQILGFGQTGPGVAPHARQRCA